MNFERFKEKVENLIYLGTKNDNPMFYAEAKGCLSGIMALCELNMFTTTEKLWVLHKFNETCVLMTQFVERTYE